MWARAALLAMVAAAGELVTLPALAGGPVVFGPPAEPVRVPVAAGVTVYRCDRWSRELGTYLVRYSDLRCNADERQAQPYLVQSVVEHWRCDASLDDGECDGASGVRGAVRKVEKGARK